VLSSPKSYIKILKDKVYINNLIVFLDNCTAQNKKWTFMSTWLQLIRENTCKVIDDKVRMWSYMTSFRQILDKQRDFTSEK